MAKEKKSASDNDKGNTDSIHIRAIMDKLKKFDEHTDPRQNEELRIIIPIGLMRFTKLNELESRFVFFDLIYAVKRLRFAVELARSSSVAVVQIESLYHDEEANMTSYIINQPMKLTLADMRELINLLIEYFQPRVFNVQTVEENQITPPETWLSELKKR